MSIPSLSLAGKVAVITGGRRGIGKTIALAFAEAGADVAVSDLVVEDGALEDVAEEIRRRGRRSLAVPVDTSRKTDVDNMVSKITGEFGAIDILVNNAAINIKAPGPLLELPEDEWDRMINIDLKGYYLCAQAVGKGMVARKQGNIISLASRFGFKAEAGAGVYAIAKAGVIMLTRVLARELGSHNIRANAIAPGMVKTEFNRHIWSNQAFLKQYESSLPLGRAAVPGDLTGTALFLASDASAYITGHTILVDGGGLA